MNWLRQAARELWGLFVEDGSLAVAILLWVGLTAFVLAALLPASWKGPVVFAGLAIILVENVLRTAKRLSKR